MSQIEKEIAKDLLQCRAVILEPSEPFTWASGWRSPIYCDNRITLSYPDIRDRIKSAFVEVIKTSFPGADVIAGVATGAIAIGALVAEALQLPFVYVRASAKGHGRKNLIEGRLEVGRRVMVVEDLISTGGSSLKAVEALREAGSEVLGMAAIFSYGFAVSEEAFRNANVELRTLSNYDSLIGIARESAYVKEEQVALLEQWRKDPSAWKP